MDSNILSLLIIIGILFLVLSIIKFNKMFKFVSNIISTENILIDYLFKINLVLILFFLIGYIILFIFHIVELKFLSEILIGIIFLFGSIFVFLESILQSNLINSLNKSNIQTIKILVSAVEARDPYTMGHSEHVANLLILLYNYLPNNYKKSLNPNILKYTGLLHDIGKIGIPEIILNSPTQLNNAEMEIMKQHTLIGEGILKNVDWLRPICKWVLYHHERIDGTGYYQLKDEDIPFASKMISVVDTYSSLVTERKYRPAKSHDEAIAILKSASPAQLDLQLVNIFSYIDYQQIFNCLPNNKAITTPLNKDLFNNDNFDQISSLLNKQILNKETGIICIKKYLDLADRIKIKLTFIEIYFDGVEENINTDYHEIDKLNNDIENILNKRVRKSDISCRINSFNYLLLFQNCSISTAVEITEKMISNLNKIIKKSALNAKIDIKIKYYEYIPGNIESLKQINSLLTK